MYIYTIYNCILYNCIIMELYSKKKRNVQCPESTGLSHKLEETVVSGRGYV